MHMIALEPKELYMLWADGSGAGVEEVDWERCVPTCALLNIFLPCRAVKQPASGP